MPRKLKGTVVSVYVPDNAVMNKIREKSAQGYRSVSSWAYLVMQNAALQDDDDTNKEEGGRNE
jgi:hypothetical protein